MNAKYSKSILCLIGLVFQNLITTLSPMANIRRALFANQAMLNGMVESEALAISGANKAYLQYVAGLKVANIAEVSFAQKCNIATKALLAQAAAWLATPAGAITVIAAAILGVVGAVNHYNKKIQEYVDAQKEIVETSSENIQKYQDEISSLEALQKKLNDAHGDKAKLVDVSVELNKIFGETPGLLNDEAGAYDVANAKIRARINELKALADVEKTKKVNAQKEIFSSNTLALDWWKDPIEVGLDVDIAEAAYQTKLAEATNDYLTKDLGLSEDSHRVKYFNSRIARYKEFLQQKADEAKAVFDDWLSQQFSDTTTRGYLDRYIEDLVMGGEDDLENIDAKLNIFASKIEEFNTLKDNLLGAKSRGEDYTGEYEALQSFINELASDMPEATGAIDSMKVGFDSLMESISSMDGAEAIVQNTADALESISQSIDTLQSAYNAVSSAIKEYNEQGYLSVDAYQALVQVQPKYLGMLVDEEGNLNLTSDALNNYTSALIDNLAQKQIVSIVDYVATLGDEERQLWLNSQAADAATDSMQSFIETTISAKLATGEWSDEDIGKLTQKLNGIAAWADSAKAGIYQGGLGSGNSNTKKEAEDAAKKIKDINKKLAELAKKESLDVLKQGIEEARTYIDQFSKSVDLQELRLELADDSDYTTRADALAVKFDLLKGKTSAMRNEFERLNGIMPTSADEASELANRMETLGNDMRTNVKDVISLRREIELLNVEMISGVADEAESQLDRMLKRIDNDIATISDGNIFSDSAFNMDFMLPVVSQSAVERKRRENDKLIREEERYQSDINDIISTSLKMQSEENAKARAEERESLLADLEEARAIVSEKSAQIKQTATQNAAETKTNVVNNANETKAGVSNAITEIANMQIDPPKLNVSAWGRLENDVKARLERMTAAITPQGMTGGGSGGSMGSINPVAGKLSSQYGKRTAPTKGASTNHDGIDIAADMGAPVKTVGNGTVVVAKVNGGYGNYVEIDHGNGLHTFYAHLSAFNVKAGDRVSTGDVIGLVGSTGTSTGPHLHLGASVNGQSTDPSKYIKGYSEGTGFHTGGYAVVGDNADGRNVKRPELAIFPDGHVELVGQNGVELRDFPEGTKVIPYDETKKVLRRNQSVPKYASGTYVDPAEIAAYISQTYPEITPQGIAGILGNIYHESNFNPKDQTTEAYGSGSSALIDRWGLFQLDAERVPNIAALAQAGDWQGQIDAALANGRYENSGMGGNSAYNVWDKLLTNSSLSPETVAEEFDRLFERSDGSTRSGRAAMAREYFDQLSDGILNAAGRITGEVVDDLAAYKNKAQKQKFDALVKKYGVPSYYDKEQVQKYSDYVSQRKAAVNNITVDIEKLSDLSPDSADYKNLKGAILEEINAQTLKDTEFLYGFKADSLKKAKDEYETFYNELAEAYREYVEKVNSGDEVYDEKVLQEYIDRLSDLEEQLRDVKNEITDATKSIIEAYQKIDAQKFKKSQETANRIDFDIAELEHQRSMTDNPASQAEFSKQIIDKYGEKLSAKQAIQDMAHASAEELRTSISDVLGEQTIDTDSWFDMEGNFTSAFEEFRSMVTDEETLQQLDVLASRLQTEKQIYMEAEMDKWELQQDMRDSSKELDEQLLDQFKQAMDNELEAFEKAVSKQKENLDFLIAQTSSKTTLLQKHYDLINSITDEGHNISKELQASLTMYEYLDDETRKLLFNQEDYNALQSELNGLLTEADKLQNRYLRDLSSAEPENIAKITADYERQYELVMKKYEISKAELEVTKKQQQLNNVLAEKNVRMLIDGKWQWVANTQDVVNAQNELADAKYNQSQTEDKLEQTRQVQSLQARQDTLEMEKNYLDKELSDMTERWDKLVTNMEYNSQSVSDVLNVIAVSGGEGLHRIVNRVGEGLGELYTLLTGLHLDESDLGYDNEIDYMSLMQLVPEGSLLWEYLNNKRNFKIDAENRTEEKIQPKRKYATGTKSALPGVAQINEIDDEGLILRNGAFVPLANFSGGETVFSHAMMENLWKQAQIPVDQMLSSLPGSDGTSITERNNIFHGDIIVNNPADYDSFLHELNSKVQMRSSITQHSRNY